MIYKVAALAPEFLWREENMLGGGRVNIVQEVHKNLIFLQYLCWNCTIWSDFNTFVIMVEAGVNRDFLGVGEWGNAPCGAATGSVYSIKIENRELGTISVQKIKI